MSDIIVTHKIYGEGTVESIEQKDVFENTYFTAHFKGDGSYRKFLIFDRGGKLTPFLKFFANNPEAISFFESYKAHYYDSSKPFPKDMIHITPKVVEEDAKKDDGTETAANATISNTADGNMSDITETEVPTETVEDSIVEKSETRAEYGLNETPVISDEPPVVKRGRGRPKKSEVKTSDVVAPVKRGRGRPKKQ